MSGAIVMAAKTMTSREIAHLVESRHDNVKRSIDRLVDSMIIAAPPTEEYLDSMGRKAVEYKIGKRDSYVIVAQLSPAFTARLVDRWQELENAAPAVQLPQSFASALRLAAEQAEQIEAQALQIAAAAPAVAFVDGYVDATGTKGFRAVCKLLGAKEPEFREFLRAKGVMYKLGGEWVPTAPHLDAGRMQVKAGSAESGHAFNVARFTAKGINWVAGEWAKHKLEGKL